jgi:hypothetical protein
VLGVFGGFLGGSHKHLVYRPKIGCGEECRVICTAVLIDFFLYRY